MLSVGSAWSDDDCVFCRRIENDEFDFMDSFRTTVSFEPLNPVVEGHRLFVPIIHGKSASKQPVSAALAFQAAARYIEMAGIENANLITSDGAHATQTILHTHVHLVPRREGDGLALPWTGQIT